MTFAELQTKTRRQLNETSAVFWTDADIKASINEGYQELADATEFYERHAMIPLLEGCTYYDLTAILPDTFLSPRRAYNVDTDRWLTPSGLTDLDYHTYTQWELTEGPPEKYWLRGNWWLGVFPKPSADSEGIRLYYTAIPPAMVNSDDDPVDIPREFHEGIVAFAVADSLMQKRDMARANPWWERYIGFQAQLMAYVERRTNLAARSVL